MLVFLMRLLAGRYLAILKQQSKTFAATVAEYAETSFVQRNDRCDLKFFSRGNQRRIGEIHGYVRVLFHQGCCPVKHSWGENIQDLQICGPQKLEQPLWPAAERTKEMHRLGQHRSGRHETARHVPALANKSVLGIAPVQVRYQGTCIDQDEHSGRHFRVKAGANYVLESRGENLCQRE